MSLQLKIKQQEATVTMLKTLLKAKRATEREVQAAEAELNRLRSVSSSTVPSAPAKKAALCPPKSDRRPDYQKAIEETLQDDPYSLKQKNLTLEANRLRQEQARLSNLLHKVPRNQACPELTEKIVALQDEIEGIWDEKKFLERNEDTSIPVAQPITPAAAVPTTIESITNKAVLSVEIQKLREKRAKLRKKMEDLRASASKRAAWSLELAQTEAAISEKTLAKEALN